jgi:hypothetical protein
MRPETLARYRGVSPAYLAQYCRLLSVRAYTWGFRGRLIRYLSE